MHESNEFLATSLFLISRARFSSLSLPNFKFRQTRHEEPIASQHSFKRDAYNRDSASSFVISHRSNENASATAALLGETGSDASAFTVSIASHDNSNNVANDSLLANAFASLAAPSPNHPNATAINSDTQPSIRNTRGTLNDPSNPFQIKKGANDRDSYLVF